MVDFSSFLHVILLLDNCWPTRWKDLAQTSVNPPSRATSVFLAWNSTLSNNRDSYCSVWDYYYLMSDSGVIVKTSPFFVVNAFANRPFGGNPAAVFPTAAGFSEQEMQAVAKQLNPRLIVLRWSRILRLSLIVPSQLFI